MKPSAAGAGSPRKRLLGGQALSEFALVSIPFLLMLFGMLDFGLAFADNIALADASRAAARYGAVYSSNLSNTDPAPSNSIQGQLQATAGITGIKNNDSSIIITYYVPGSGTPTQCGQYSQSAGAISYAVGYNQANCLMQGNLIKVQAKWKYSMITPLLASLYPSGLQLQSSSVMMIER